MSDILNTTAVCINEQCVWNLKGRCKLPDLCPARNRVAPFEKKCTPEPPKQEATDEAE